jgi:hypothetical protein
MSSPRSSGIAAHSGHTHLDSLIAAPSSEKDVFLRSTSRTLAGGGYKHHAVHITEMGRVDDILCRDAELGAGRWRAYEDDVAISSLNKFPDAIARFEVGGPSLRARVTVEKFVWCKPWGRCARRLLWWCAWVEDVTEVVPL